LFYDRKFDCVPQDRGRQYPSKLGFESTHTRVLDLVPRGARVVDLGSGLGAVGAALKQQKQCRVFGCDTVKGPAVEAYDRFVIADLNDGLPDFGDEPVDYILALDVIEHLKSPEEFLDALRALAAKKRAQIILTTANVAFVLMRLSLLLGRFEYGKRGILDLTHTRLFTMHTLRRALITAGLESRRMEGVVVPIPLVFGDTRLSRILSAINRALVKVWPSLFGFQLLVVARARPTLATLLEAAEDSSKKKLAAMTVEEVN
jgi:2-polyprenyl-3-methyl-5-hydroxy-6-metoxy-1,4-benzoquinol methylase